MKRRVSAGLNAALGHIAPERRIFFKSKASTRVMRVTPAAQIGFVLCLAAFLGWTGFATYQNIKNVDLSAKVIDADARIVALYEDRIAKLTAEKHRLAERLSEAKSSAATSARELSDRHSDLGAALASQQDLDAALDVKRIQLHSLSVDFEAATKAYAQTMDRLKITDVELGEMAAARDEAENALGGVSDLLSTVSVERDLAAAEAEVLTNRVAELETAFAVKRDQQERLVSRLEDAAKLSLGSLEKVFASTGVDIDPVLTAVRSEYSGAGGLFRPMPDEHGFAPSLSDDNRVSDLLSDLDRINSLRIAIDRLPFSRPVGPARFTSGYGPRKDPLNGRRSFHAGLDMAGPRGTPIYAAGAGTVIFSARQRGYGNLIKIRHAFGYETVYAHLNRRRVKVGDRVERGDRIGDMGNTGRSTGTHLHYEIRVNGNTINPAKYIEAARNVL